MPPKAKRAREVRPLRLLCCVDADPVDASQESPAPVHPPSVALTACAELASTLSASAGRLRDLEANLLARFAASQRDVMTYTNVAREALEGLGAATQRESHSAAARQLKQLEAEAEVFEVPRDQLLALAVQCDLAIAGGDLSEMLEAVISGHLASGQLGARHKPFALRPLVSTCVSAPAVLREVEGAMRVRAGVHAAGCVVGGRGFRGFVPGTGHSRNLVTVVCKDDAGDVIHSLCPGEVCVSLIGAIPTGPCVRDGDAWCVMYVVPPPPPPAALRDHTVTLSVSVFDAPLPASPWRIGLSGCEGDGSFVTSLGPLKYAEYNVGIAVSHDEKHLFVSNWHHKSVSVHALADGTHIRTFGGPAVFNAPFGLAATPKGTLLVAETKNKRVSEVSVRGKLVRHIGVGVIDEEVVSVCVDDRGETCAVGKGDGRTQNRILLFSLASGALVAKIAGYGKTDGKLACVDSVRFLPVQEGIVATDAPRGRLAVYTLQGDFRGYVGDGRLGKACDIAFTAGGEWMVADAAGSRVRVISPDGRPEREWGQHGPAPHAFRALRALAVMDTHVYVVDALAQCVKVFT